ncbi:MAG TPA: EAL domain-containing protein [Gallionellaceae bacterium]|nr:EAL domain-containing protein [Gallionellaceae bacterium]
MTERTLLLVDDEEEITAALSRLLRGAGYTILRAHSGKEALSLLAQHPVGVIVSDQRMPEMTGVEFLSQVKEMYPKTMRMVLSGYADLNSVTDAINRGEVYRFLNKPWDNDVLCGAIQDAFRLYELRREEERLAVEIQIAKQELERVNLELGALVKRKESQIEHLSHFDALTGLPNRLLFYDRLKQVLERGQRDDRMAAVMLLDLDRFKQVNDSFGHPVGDQLLQSVARRLETQLRAVDTVARIGGDEFAFVLSNLHSAHEAGDFAQRILDSFMRDAIQIGDSEVFVAASMGISIFPLDGLETTTLVKNADAALFHAKNEGRNNYQYYAAQMNAMAWQRIKLETSLRLALEREEFVLYYQPKVDLVSGKMIGMEALLRWRSPERGLVPPDEFIGLLEETGLMLQVGEWVLRAACKQGALWVQSGFSSVRIAVNLSVLQFRQADLSGMVQRICNETGLDLGMGTLELELTESLIMKNADDATITLNRLHEMGVSLAIDDFGTGYSSLSYLKRFPISTLKIDQSFICDLADNQEDVAIVTAIVALGHSLGLKVIAEGVETFEQLQALRTMKCDEIQGYLFSRPVPVAEMTALLLKGERLNLSALNSSGGA